MTGHQSVVCVTKGHCHSWIKHADMLPDIRSPKLWSDPRDKEINEGIDLLPAHASGNVPPTGMLSNASVKSKGKAPISPQLAGSVPADTYTLWHVPFYSFRQSVQPQMMCVNLEPHLCP